MGPFLWFDWSMAWIVYWCSKISFFRVLEYVGKLSIVTGVILYIYEAPERKQRTLSDAWLLINSANSAQGLAGRYHALQYLAQQGAPLEGVRIFMSDLSGIDFRNANLRGANISYSKLNKADLANADLSEANLQSTSFFGANLSGAKFLDADLLFANFQGSIGLKPDQIKKGINWQSAIYDEGLCKALGLTGDPCHGP
jgi:hypothetical protein